jgi:hypothetical protein
VILSILDINKKNRKKQVRKTIWVYLIMTILMIVINKVYGLFGHGVHSAAMTWMFLYPLLGGVLLFFLLDRLLPEQVTRFSGYRLFYNSYNSGIATLTVGSFLKGVFAIAGTDSAYLAGFYVAGGLFIAGGLSVLGVLMLNCRKNMFQDRVKSDLR